MTGPKPSQIPPPEANGSYSMMQCLRHFSGHSGMEGEHYGVLDGTNDWIRTFTIPAQHDRVCVTNPRVQDHEMSEQWKCAHLINCLLSALFLSSPLSVGEMSVFHCSHNLLRRHLSPKSGPQAIILQDNVTVTKVCVTMKLYEC